MRADSSPPDAPPTPKTPVSLADLRAAGAVLDWLRDYICMPHPDLGRSGPVCPFVPQSLRTDQVRIVLHDEIDGSDPDRIAGLLRDYLAEFVATTPSNAVARRQRSLVIVLPGVAAPHMSTLDSVHRAVKPDMVRGGAMLGQFYEGCPETAVRNPDFAVSTGPVPCFVIRHMAPHDVLFLHQRPDWFAEYHRRFAADYAAGKVTDPLMVQLFRRAEEELENR
ncbi:DUF6875 domain-containing protein [Goodfellowiella coeruleoviolacea]|uniref:DUF6875 domain-containing protein n=1 Tax=Goodfellowiella coeruleoviolacea TaxID=334858 RepID=A0AAE3GJU7_9PSEU|nr:hypothetical protein [Goodfellowiella coeruleoviolacea]MCP2168579.1 hypothetical protein [Goodfellowiella coeruleoviolacea]